MSFETNSEMHEKESAGCECCGKAHCHCGWRRGRWMFFIPLIPVAIAGMIAAKGAVVMLVWNALIPDLFHGPTLNFLQAVGLSILAKLLVGFGGGGHHHWKGRHGGWHRGRWRKHRARWLALSPEEREKLKQEMQHSCGDDK